MDAATLRRLEFPIILERLAAECTFEPARELAAKLRPSDDPATVARWHREVAEARRFLGQFRGLSTPLADIRAALRRAAKGGRLRGTQLVEVADFAQAQAELGSAIRRDGSLPLLAERAEALQPCDELVRALRAALTDEGDLRDQASPELARLRQRSRELQQRIRQTLEGLVRSLSRSGYLQEPLITQRRGRFVLPVKAEHRGQVPGLVHDRSGSGMTLFIEPAVVTELNDELRAIEAAAEREAERILDELTRRVAAVAPQLSAAVEAVAYLDFTLARARLARAMDAVEPRLRNEPVLRLIGARHPLLGGRAVPIDIEIGFGFDILVITGPNTGGKTVTLKTVGLLAAMCQAGLQIPCREAECGVFRRIFADIGDEQSIEQNLSTFSGHMSNILGFLPVADTNTLLLLDELGAGTDPEEGAALAMALLDHVRAVGARAVVTTHFGQLKAYAARHPRVRNASVEFDPETLQPTYRLRIGQPGRSHALQVARQLGMPPELIEAARSYLTQGAVRLEDALAELERSRRQLEAERAELKQARGEVERLRAAWERRIHALEAARRRFLEVERAEAITKLNRVYDQAEALIQELRRARETGGPTDERLGLRARERLRGLRQEVDAILGEVERAASPRDGQQVAPVPAPDGFDAAWASGGHAPPRLEPGTPVWVESLQQVGTVLEPPDASGELRVRIGALTVRVHTSQLRAGVRGADPPPADEGSRATAGTAAELSRVKAAEVNTELHLRGLTTDEALWRLDKYLDDAFLAGLPAVRIVHGKGTGTLRQAVHAFLRQDRRVADFRLGGPGEGSYGVTIVRLASR